MRRTSSEHLCAWNMPHSYFWIVNEKLIWWGSDAEVRVRGAAQGNSKSLYMMRFQLVHYSHCYLCISGSCQYPVGASAGKRKLDIFGKVFLRERKARIEELNLNMSINSRRSFIKQQIFVSVGKESVWWKCNLPGPWARNTAAETILFSSPVF